MNEIKKAALHAIDAHVNTFTAISDAIWDEPELSLKEFKAAALYTDALEKLGFTVQKNLCGIETAFSGSYGSGHPVIGILGEFDALSGLSQQSTGTNNSCIQVLYKFHGVAAHAAGDPHNGRSALDAVELMNIGVQFLREHMTDDCRIHYAITDAGGVSPNVVQANASVLYMVRANKVADSVKLQKCVDTIAEGAALMTGTSYERVFIDGTAETLPNFTLEALLHASFAETGVPQYTAEELAFASSLCRTFPPQTRAPGIGAKFDSEIAKESRALSENMTKPMNDFLLPLYSGEGFLPGSTDVGDVSWQTPTAQALIAAWPAGVPGHSWQVVACGKTSLAHKAILCAGKALATAAIALIDDPALLQKAREEYAGRAGSGYVCPIEPDTVPIAI